MQQIEHLRSVLQQLDRRGYKGYQRIRGEYRAENGVLAIDHVQGDPFAAPSRIRFIGRAADFDWPDYERGIRRIALEDYIARRASRIARKRGAQKQGSGKSGQVLIDAGGQEVLERTACRITDSGHVELRMSVGLPAAGRSILGRAASELLTERVINVAEEAFRLEDLRDARRFVDTVEDASSLRDQLQGHGLIAFVANGSVLPRTSGVSQVPLTGEVIPFHSPDELVVELTAPNTGPISGMGIPEGVTLIVGGGFHGKSTLLEAVSRGIYNHIAGDGREFVVTRDDGVKIRAEDGRRVEALDLEAFIRNLPLGRDTAKFSTENASGSTSQAANILEAIEVGSRLLIMDEDTCATNFMIRDRLMRDLVPSEKEPITPLIDRVRSLHQDAGVSTLLVMGGTGDYFHVADHVIWMDQYRPHVVTERARELAGREPLAMAADETFPPVVHRHPDPASIDPTQRNRTRVRARGTEEVGFGSESIDLRQVEQIVDPSQTRAIGDALASAVKTGLIRRDRTMRELVEAIDQRMEEQGLEGISAHSGHPGDYARPRRFEIAAAINRLRTLRAVQSRT